MTDEQLKRFWIGFFSVPLGIGFFIGNFLIANYFFEAGSPAWLAVAFWWFVPAVASGIGMICAFPLVDVYRNDKDFS